VRMPSSLQAQITRRAISPRFAIRIFLNFSGKKLFTTEAQRQREKQKMGKIQPKQQRAITNRTVSVERLFQRFGFLCVSVVNPLGFSVSLW
jgi:hypothetical protein